MGMHLDRGSRRIIITLPEDHHPEQDADYICEVAKQLEGGYLSGHVDAEHHWTMETDPRIVDERDVASREGSRRTEELRRVRGEI